VDDDAVGPGQLRQSRSRHRVRLIGEAGLSQGRHMVYVYFQSRHAVFSYQNNFSSRPWAIGPPAHHEK
jgi:hypothetical protein